jgi:hypothetical protein
MQSPVIRPHVFHVFHIILFFSLMLAGFGYCQAANQTDSQPQSFTLIYSSNVLGEYSPCG